MKKDRALSTGHNHEDFDVPTSPELVRPHLVRQDRLEVPEGMATALIGPNRYPILSISSFGLLIKSSQRFEDNFQGMANVQIGEIKIFDIEFQKVREVQGENGIWLIGLESTNQVIPMEKTKAGILTQSILRDSMLEYQKSKKLPEKFRLLVFEAKNTLEKLETNINALEQGAPKADRLAQREFEDSIVEVTSRAMSTEFAGLYTEMKNILESMPADQMAAAFTFFREEMKNILYKAPFGHRVFYKPKGYAGDYEMMNIIYRAESVGDSLFAKCIHYYLVNEPASKAVRNRADYLNSKISAMIRGRSPASANKLRFLSVASGPAREIQMLIEKENQETLAGNEFCLLDQDIDALKEAQRAIKQIALRRQVNPQISLYHKAIKNVISEGIGTSGFDLIYSAGLFDYFTEPVAIMAAKRLYEALNPGGTLIIGNFNVTNPNQMTMDMGFDWRLIYRSRETLQKMFAGIGASFDIEEEQQGINLFCIIRKHGSKLISGKT